MAEESFGKWFVCEMREKWWNYRSQDNHQQCLLLNTKIESFHNNLEQKSLESVKIHEKSDHLTSTSIDFCSNVESPKKKQHLKVTFLLLCFSSAARWFQNLIATTDTPCLFFAILVALSWRFPFILICKVSVECFPIGKDSKSPNNSLMGSIRTASFDWDKTGINSFYLAEKIPKKRRKHVKTSEKNLEHQQQKFLKYLSRFLLDFSKESEKNKVSVMRVKKKLFWCSCVDTLINQKQLSKSVYVKRYQ